MADQDPNPAGNGADGAGTDPQAATLAQYIKDLSVESPSAPQVFQWQDAADARRPVPAQRQQRVRRRPRSHAEDRGQGAVGQRRALPRRPELRRPVRAPQLPGGSARRRSCWSKRRACCSRSRARSSPSRSRTPASRRCCSTRSTSPPPTWRSCRASRIQQAVGGDGEAASDAGRRAAKLIFSR